MSRPTIGSASGKPSQAPPALSTTARRGEPVGAGVQAVGDQGGRADPAADPRSGSGRRPRCRRTRSHRPRPAHRGGRARRGSGKRWIAWYRRATAEAAISTTTMMPGQVLGPAVAVGVAAGRRPATEHERDAERDSGQRVGDVVQGVAEQRHRARVDTTITACASAVSRARRSEIHRQRMPSRLASSAESTLSALSCECGTKISLSLPRSPSPWSCPWPVAMTVVVSRLVRVVVVVSGLVRVVVVVSGLVRVVVVVSGLVRVVVVVSRAGCGRAGGRGPVRARAGGRGRAGCSSLRLLGPL